MEAVVRLAGDDDLDSICGFVNDAEQLFLFAPAATYPLTREQLQDTLKRRLHSSVLEYRTRVIGFANFYDYRTGDYCFIGNVIVHHDYRGRGYGQQLTEHMMQVGFDAYNFRELRISVFAHNVPAMRLYRKLGFQFYDSETRCSPGGEKVELLHLRCDYSTYIRNRSPESVCREGS